MKADKEKMIRHQKLPTPLKEVLEKKENKRRNSNDGIELRRLEEPELHHYGLGDGEINTIQKMYTKLRRPN